MFFSPQRRETTHNGLFKTRTFAICGANDSHRRLQQSIVNCLSVCLLHHLQLRLRAGRSCAGRKTGWGTSRQIKTGAGFKMKNKTVRSLLYRSRFLQLTTHCAAFFERINKICTRFHRSTFKIWSFSQHFPNVQWIIFRIFARFRWILTCSSFIQIDCFESSRLDCFSSNISQTFRNCGKSQINFRRSVYVAEISKFQKISRIVTLRNFAKLEQN